MVRTTRLSTIFNGFKIGGIVAIPLVLLALPANFFDSGESVCLSHVLFDMDCYGCGITRAIQHLIHLEWQSAWEFNKLSFIVLPLLAGVGIQELRKSISSIKKRAEKATASPGDPTKD